LKLSACTINALLFSQFGSTSRGLEAHEIIIKALCAPFWVL